MSEEKQEKSFKNKNSFTNYLFLSISLFLAISMAIVVFFIIEKIDSITGFFNHIFKVMMPFIIGAAMAYVICPLCNVLERFYLKIINYVKGILKKTVEDNENNLKWKKLRSENIARTASTFSGIVIAVIVVYLILMILIPHLITSVIRLVQIMPESADKVIAFVESKLGDNEQLALYFEQGVDKAYEMLEDWLNNGLLESVQNLFTGISTGVVSVINILGNFFIGIIVAVYLLLSRKKLAKQAKLIVYSIFKEDKAKNVISEVKYIDKVFSGFINGKILDAVIVAFICYLGLMVFKMLNPGAVTMSEVLCAVIVGIFNIIPFFGWYIGLGLSAVLILIINPVQCLYFVIFDFILQQIDGNILGPKILGNTTGISSLWVLFAIFLFGDLWGFAGMFIGVPLFAIIYHGIKKLVFKGLYNKNQAALAEEYLFEYPEKDDDPVENDDEESFT